MTSSDVHSPEMPLAIRPFLREVEVRPDEQSSERSLKLALRRLPENVRLSFFAHAITSPLPALPCKNGLEIQKVWISSPFS